MDRIMLKEMIPGKIDRVVANQWLTPLLGMIDVKLPSCKTNHMKTNKSTFFD
jgi:hypothetical protein